MIYAVTRITKAIVSLRPVATTLGKEEEQTYSMNGPLQEGGILAMTSAVKPP